MYKHKRKREELCYLTWRKVFEQTGDIKDYLNYTACTRERA